MSTTEEYETGKVTPGDALEIIPNIVPRCGPWQLSILFGGVHIEVSTLFETPESP